jgi:transcriptional regulator with XRE-family HTH domain/dephospho-CoA kinase
MIKNERQYRITKSQAQKFESAIRELEPGERQEGVHPLLHQAQVNALRSQLRELQADLSEYDALRAGGKPLYDFTHFEQIPSALIRARIAQGLTQEELAERLGLQPQQIQRYESTDYQSASLSRVAEVIRALDLPVPEGLDASGRDFSLAKLLGRLKGVGLDEEFVKQRLLPRPSGSLTEGEGNRDNDIVLEAAEGLDRIYGWSPAVLFGSDQLTSGAAPAASARFKLPARVKASQLGAYTVYAHYLALLVLEATPDLRPCPLPTDPAIVRNAIISRYGDLSFSSALRYIWSVGIPVLPLNDPGTFHGACWRVRGRNAIVLKQRTRSVARWLFDLLHEYFHAAFNPDLEEHLVIEENEMSPSRRESEEEQAASRFAGDVLLDGRAEELAQSCVAAARGSVERLKLAVVKVSKRDGISADVLANYMAFRLSLQGINWWGAANNLQRDGSAMIFSPREILLDHVDLTRLAPVDRNLLLRALEPVVLAFSGRIASGKSTLSAEVARSLGWKRASFGDYVRIVAKSQGLEPSREVLQDLGESLAKTPEEFCRSMLAHFGWQSGEPLVIDGVRHREIVEALRRLVAPLELRLIFVDSADEQRRERLVRKTDLDLDKMPRIESHSTEKQVSSVLPDIADLRVSTEQGLGDVVRGIVSWVHQAESTSRHAA